MPVEARVLVAALAAPVLLVSGCAVDGADPETADPSHSASSESPSEPDEIVLAIAGDVHFAERTLDLLDDPEAAFGPIADVFAAADHSTVNLETAVTDGGVPEPKEWLFRAPPAAFDAVAAAEIDMVSLANNHTLDYGVEGLHDTLGHAADAGVDVVGAGVDADAALAAQYVDVDGTVVGFLAVSAVWELWETWKASSDQPGVAHIAHDELIDEAVAETAQAADVTVVLPHWGDEGDECPNAEQLDWAQRLADAGADAIVGTHAHLLQGAGYLDQTYVAYGSGNFVWWRDHRHSNDTGVFQLIVRDGELAEVDFVPAYIDEDTGQPIPVDDAEGERIADKLDDLRDCAELSAEPG